MKKSIELYGLSKNGRLQYNDTLWKEKYSEFLSVHDGKDIQVIITVVKDAKTLAQLRFYWGVVLPAICKATGYSNRDELHTYLKGIYLTEIKELEIAGQIVASANIPSVGELDILDMKDYIDRCLEFLVDNGGSLDHDALDYYEQGWRDDTDKRNNQECINNTELQGTSIDSHGQVVIDGGRE